MGIQSSARAMALTAAALCSLVPSSPAAEKQTNFTLRQPSLERKGIDPEQLYFSIGGSEINAFNFNLVVGLTEPLGFEWQVGGGLSLTLSRIYNSNAYQRRTWWRHNRCVTRTTPALSPVHYLSLPRQNPLGLGWEFHLGRIYKQAPLYCRSALASVESCWGGASEIPQQELTVEGPWTYVAPDGSEHALLRADEAAPAGVEVYYSRDGSRLKALRHQGTEDFWELLLPDGRVLRMGQRVRGTPIDERAGLSGGTNIEPDNAAGPPFLYDLDKIGFHTSRIHLREVNARGEPAAYLEVAYHPPPFDYIVAAITDSHTRLPGAERRRIDVEINDHDPGVASYGQITRIRFPAPPGNEVDTAEFRFSYASIELGESASGAPAIADVLAGVAVGPQGYLTTYRYADRHAAEVARTPQRLQDKGTPDLGGRLIEIGLPSGKLVRLTYAAHVRLWMQSLPDIERIPPANHDSCSCMRHIHDGFVIGLRAKEVFLDGDPTNTAPENHLLWSFRSGRVLREDFTADDEARTCDGLRACFSRSRHFDTTTEMIDPSGTLRRIVFDTSTHDPGVAPEESPRFGRVVSEHWFEGREKEVRRIEYGWKVIAHDGCRGVSWVERDSRTVSYLDDQPPTSVTTRFDRWNGWNFEERSTSGNGAGPGVRIERTDFAIDNRCGPNTPQRQLQESWLPRVVAARSVSVRLDGEEKHKAATEYAFDAHTGRRLAEVRRLHPFAAAESCAQSLEEVEPRAGDHVKLYRHDEAGNLVEQTIYEAGSARRFRTFFDHNFGVLTLRRRAALRYADWRATRIDPPTGLPLEEAYGAMGADDPQAVRMAMRYDELRRPVEERVAELDPWHHEYEDEGFVDSRGGRRRRLVRLRSWQGEDPEQRSETTLHYDSAGRVHKVERLLPDGRRAFLHKRWDRAGRLGFISEWTTAERWTPALPGTTTDYLDPQTGRADPFGRPRRVIGALGETTEHDYFGTNERRRVLDVRTPLRPNSFRGVSAVSETILYYDGLGRLRALRSPDTPAYPANHAADAAYDYDHADRLVRVRLVPELQLRPEPEDRYAADGSSAQTRRLEYDALGRLTRSEHPESGARSFANWNALGSPRRIQHAAGAATGQHLEIDYDAAGRPIRIQRVLDEGQAALTSVHRAGSPGWVADGWSSQHAPACLGETAWYHGDATCGYAREGRQIARLTSPIIGPLPPGSGLSLRFVRDVRSNPGSPHSRDRLRVLVSTNPDDPDWSAADELFALDSTQISWRRWKRTPVIPLDAYADLAVRIRVEFDSVDANPDEARGIGIGELVVSRPRRTILQTMAYDEPHGAVRGRLTSVAVFDESTGQPGFAKRFHYAHSAGLLSRIDYTVDWDRSGGFLPFRTDYDHDRLGRVEQERRPYATSAADGHFPGLRLTYRYRHGGLVGIRADGGEAQWIVPDSAERPGIAYHPAGGASTIRHGNGLVSRIEANAAALPRRIWVADSGGRRLFDSGEYVYDGALNVIRIGEDRFLHDASGRLVSAVTGSGPGHRRQLLYDYDPFGNRLRADEVAPWEGAESDSTAPATLRFDLRNRLVSLGFAYDANGNLIAAPAPAPGPVGRATRRHDFSTQNRLQLIRTAGTGTIDREFRYDERGHRWLTVGGESRGAARIFLRDMRGRLLAEFVARGPDALPEPGRTYVFAEERPVAAIADGAQTAVRHLHTDHLHSVRLVTDSAGRVLAGYTYEPFGETVERTGRSEVGLRFAAHERDAGLALDYVLSRYYAAGLGRFLSVDPLERSADPRLPQSWNRYNYALNRPLVLSDPDGREWRESLKGMLKNPRFRATASFGAAMVAEQASQKLPPGKRRGAVLAASAALAGFSAVNSAQVSLAGFGIALTPEPTGTTKVAGGAIGSVFGFLFLYDSYLTAEYSIRAYENLVHDRDPVATPTEARTRRPGPAVDSPVGPTEVESGGDEEPSPPISPSDRREEE